MSTLSPIPNIATTTIAQSGMSQIVLLALVIALLTIVILSTRRRLQRSINQPRPDVRSRLSERAQHTKLARDLEEVMAELDEFARQVNGRLDTRFAKLEAVIRDADARIDQLARLLRQADGQPNLDVTVADESAPEQPPEETKPVELHADIYALADEGRTPVEIATRMDRTTGEVELILALRRTKREADAAARRGERATV